MPYPTKMTEVEKKGISLFSTVVFMIIEVIAVLFLVAMVFTGCSAFRRLPAEQFQGYEGPWSFKVQDRDIVVILIPGKEDRNKGLLFSGVFEIGEYSIDPVNKTVLARTKDFLFEGSLRGDGEEIRGVFTGKEVESPISIVARRVRVNRADWQKQILFWVRFGGEVLKDVLPIFMSFQEERNK